jgi:hypothetical protein
LICDADTGVGDALRLLRATSERTASEHWPEVGPGEFSALTSFSVIRPARSIHVEACMIGRR